MPSQTQDIEFAIQDVIDPGEQVTLAELDALLARWYPSIKSVDPRYIAVALGKMKRDGRLIAPKPDAPYSDDYVIGRPA